MAYQHAYSKRIIKFIFDSDTATATIRSVNLGYGFVSNTKFAGRITAFVFVLFGFTILFDALTATEAQVLPPGFGMLFFVVGCLAYWLTRHQ
jgi:hypothetical protein